MLLRENIRGGGIRGEGLGKRFFILFFIQKEGGLYQKQEGKEIKNKIKKRKREEKEKEYLRKY